MVCWGRRTRLPGPVVDVAGGWWEGRGGCPWVVVEVRGAQSVGLLLAAVGCCRLAGWQAGWLGEDRTGRGWRRRLRLEREHRLDRKRGSSSSVCGGSAQPGARDNPAKSIIINIICAQGPQCHYIQCDQGFFLLFSMYGKARYYSREWRCCNRPIKR